MAGLATETTSPKSILDESAVSCNCKSESALNSKITSPLNPPRTVNKKMFKKNNIPTKLTVFTGRQQKLNRAVFRVLSKNSPLAIWDILQKIKQDLKGFKRTKYAIINARVKALETQGYLRIVGTRTKKQGGSTNLYDITTKARLAISLSSISMDDLINSLKEDTALKLIKEIS